MASPRAAKRPASSKKKSKPMTDADSDLCDRICKRVVGILGGRVTQSVGVDVCHEGTEFTSVHQCGSAIACPETHASRLQSVLDLARTTNARLTSAAAKYGKCGCDSGPTSSPCGTPPGMPTIDSLLSDLRLIAMENEALAETIDQRVA